MFDRVKNMLQMKVIKVSSYQAHNLYLSTQAVLIDQSVCIGVPTKHIVAVLGKWEEYLIDKEW